MRLFKTITFLFLIISTSFAYMGSYSDGTTEFTTTKNKHGVILRSTGVQYEWVGMGVNTSIEKIEGAPRLPEIVLYLGKSCDAYSEIYGEGTWGWANGGFVITFKNETFGFGRQELSIDTDEEFCCRL